MSEDTNSTMNNNNEQSSVFSEQDKELASKAKQEYEAGQYDSEIQSFTLQIFNVLISSLFENLTKTTRIPS